MADALGFLGKMGIKVVGAWDSAYAAVDVAIPFLNESFTPNYTRMQVNSLIGYGGREPSEQGNFNGPGAIEAELDYNNFGLLIKAVMGAEAGGVYTIVDQLDQFAWVEFEKQIGRHRVGANVFHKMVISGAKDEICKIAFDAFARSFDVSGTAFPGISPAAMTKTRFTDMAFRIGDQANALAGGDAVEIESFEITLDRSMKLDDYVNDQTPIQPVEGDFRVCGFNIKLPRYAADTFIDWKEADTPLQADFIFTRGAESITIQLTEVRVTGGFDSPIGGPNPLTVEGELEAYRGGAHGYMYAGNEMKITIV